MQKVYDYFRKLLCYFQITHFFCDAEREVGYSYRLNRDSVCLPYNSDTCVVFTSSPMAQLSQVRGYGLILYDIDLSELLIDYRAVATCSVVVETKDALRLRSFHQIERHALANGGGLTLRSVAETEDDVSSEVADTGCRIKCGFRAMQTD